MRRPAPRFAALIAALLVGCTPTTAAPTANESAAPDVSSAPSVVARTPAPTTRILQPTATPSPTAAVTPEPTPAPVARLDGLPADAATTNRLPLAVMIDDNVVARPQSGFNAASIVYQAPADGGEDRYMLVFQELDAPDIGPVRSGRPYFVYWAAEYRAGFAHYGGDEQTLTRAIPSTRGTLIFDLDALNGSGAAFHRITTRKKPHNAYTSTAALWKVAARKGYPATISDAAASRPFKDDAATADLPASGSITVPYGRGATGYTYDRESNAYFRSVAGKAQIDAADGKRVTARNVVVLFMKLSIDPNSEPGHNRPVLAQTGQGSALVFRDGSVVAGTWRKKDAGDLTRFYDAAGNEISLNRGRIFVQVVATGTKVSYDAKAG